MKKNKKPQSVPSLVGIENTKRLTTFEGIILDTLNIEKPVMKDTVSQLRSETRGSLDRVAKKVEDLMLTLQTWPSSGYFNFKGKQIDPTDVFVLCDRLLDHTMLEIDAKSTHTTLTASSLLEPINATNHLLRLTVDANEGNAAKAFKKLERALPFIIDELRLGSKRFYSSIPTPSDVLIRCKLVLAQLQKARTPLVDAILDAPNGGNSFSLDDFRLYLDGKGIFFSPDEEDIASALRLKGRIHTVVNGTPVSVKANLADLPNYTILLTTEDTHKAHVVIRALAEKTGHTPLIYRNKDKQPVELVTSFSIYPHNPAESGPSETGSNQIRVPLNKLNGHNLDGTTMRDLNRLSKQGRELPSGDQDR